MGALAPIMLRQARRSHFQPMGANFGILPPLAVTIRDKQERYAALAERALQCLSGRLMQAGNRTSESE